ncbi:MAG: hypothetical protein AAF677_08645, partial [Pseudomonadota bacterium]
MRRALAARTRAWAIGALSTPAGIGGLSTGVGIGAARPVGATAPKAKPISARYRSRSARPSRAAVRRVAMPGVDNVGTGRPRLARRAG